MKRLTVLFLVAVIAFCFASCESSDKANTSESTQQTKTADISTDENESILMSTEHYKVSEDMFRYFYMSNYSNQMNSYGNVYQQYYGLDTSKSLKDQEYNNGQTWYEYFVEQAENSVKTYLSTSEVALADGAADNDKISSQVDSVIEQYKAQAESQNISLDELFNKYIGESINEQDVRDSLTLAITASNYFSDLQASFDFSEEDCKTYADAHDSIDQSNTGITMNVRHILFESSNYDSEEAAKARAEEIYGEWKSGEATEASFAALAGEYTEDPGSKSTGGLYEGVTEGQMVTEFNDWIFNADRKIGDTEIIKTSYGYHIMYFSGSGEAKWITEAKSALSSEKLESVSSEAEKRFPVAIVGEIPDME